MPKTGVNIGSEVQEILDGMYQRLSSIESILALSEQEKILAQLREAVAGSSRKAQIMLLARNCIPRQKLMDTLSLSQQSLTNFVTPLLKHYRVLHQYYEGKELIYCWAPHLQMIQPAYVLAALSNGEDRKKGAA